MSLGVDALLRAEGRFALGHGPLPLGRLIGIVLLGGFTYGAAMGCFGLRPLQALYSGLKVPLLIATATALCLPMFFVLNTLLGLRDDFGAALRGVLSAQATVAVMLAACAPLVLLAYATSSDYVFGMRANGGLFLLAALAGQRTLERHYEPLVRRDPLHARVKRAWLVLYVFVAIQAAWVLRPFVGDPNYEPTFLREDLWSNAYVVILRDVLGLWRR